MPKAEEYAEAIAWMEQCQTFPALAQDATLALRWLRVGAAMEAGTLFLEAPGFAGGHWSASDTTLRRQHYAPDPLTAAERAMGVAT